MTGFDEDVSERLNCCWWSAVCTATDSASGSGCPIQVDDLPIAFWFNSYLLMRRVGAC